MVQSCCAINCTARRQKGTEIKLKFFKIPKDPVLRKKWLLAIKRENFKPSEYTRICEKHFTEEDFQVNVHGNRVLKLESVPSLFDFPIHLQKKVATRRPLKRKRSTSPELTIVEPCVKQKDVYNTVISRGENEQSVDIRGTLEVHDVVQNDLDVQNTIVSVEMSVDIDQIPSTSTQETFCKRNPRDPVYFGDFKESDLDDNVKRKRFWKVAHDTVTKSKRISKYYQNVSRRQRDKIKSLNSLLDKLMQEKKISSEQLLMLKESVPEMQRALLFRQIKQGSRGGKYSPQLRTFALTLNFYSASAYQYVRQVFGKYSLPHPRTLAKWYSTVDGRPGYSAEALRAVSNRVAIEKDKGKQLVAGLVMDEMSIREHVHWTGSRNVGYVDFGTGMQDSDQLPEAKNVLVIMLVGYNSRWKVPIAYFLIEALSAEEKAKLVRGCFLQMEKTGILIKSLTFDGCASNISMANLLGAKLSYPDTKPYFVNTVNNEKVHIILDACHMVKLIRNTLGDWGILFDGDGIMVQWNYFKELVKVQDDSGLHCATRLRSRHINYVKEKMKVKLAVQTFSTSVADALDYCNEDLNIPCFQNSEATSNFCRRINDIFDFLNVRNFYGKILCKRPLFKGSNEFVKNFVRESVEYLSSLKDKQGNVILLTGRKTGFLGLIVCLLSVQNLFIELVLGNKLDFLLSYKLSQDHLEMFFSAIRSRGGFSNNPTAWHFEMAYKRLLIHSEVAASEGANCLAQDNTSILNVSSKNSSENTSTADLLFEVDEFTDVDEVTFIKNYSNVSNCLYISDVVEYIAGFISRKLTRVLNCNECANALTNENSLSLLLRKKDRGGLCKPSRDVVKICIVAESIIKSETNFSSSMILVKLISLAIRKLNLNSLFLELGNHFKEQDPLNTHHIQIIRLILKNYLTIRIHHINSTKNEPRSRIRQHLTKTIIFSHQ